MCIRDRYFWVHTSFQNKPLIVTIFLAVSGWIVNTYLQQKNFKQEQKAKINFDIYSQLVSAHRELQNSIGPFNASATVHPLKSMNAVFEVDKFSLTEIKALRKGMKKHFDWVDTLLASEDDYHRSLFRFLYMTQDWTAPLGSLQRASEILSEETIRLNGLQKDHTEILCLYATKNGHDWRQWSDEDIHEHGGVVSGLVGDVSSYIDDFMVLAHNELLAPYYGHERMMRETADDTQKVLTKEGLEVRLKND